jgi:hypothetical protein
MNEGASAVSPNHQLLSGRPVVICGDDPGL